MSEPLLAVSELSVAYHLDGRRVPAVQGVSLDVHRGEIVGIVGESGCGKTSVGTAVIGLLPANGEVTGGRIAFRGHDVLAMSAPALRSIRGREVAMIFQDPLTSLNPTLSIGSQLVGVQRAHGSTRDGAKSMEAHAVETLTRVGIPDAQERIDDYPHQFSGGMRQRIMIGMALLLRPALLIADEPTASLDVTLEAQIVELLLQLRSAHDTAILFVSHDLAVIAQTCDRVFVMYSGRVVETGDVASVFRSPHHPYTRALLGTIPSRKQRGGRLETIPGHVPGDTLQSGCRFRPRCRFSRPVCGDSEPGLLRLGAGRSRCFMHDPGLQAHWGAADRDALTRPASATKPKADDSSEGTEVGSMLVTAAEARTYYSDRGGVVQRLLGRQRQPVKAVDGVTLEIARGEIVGLVGESGSGKTTLGETLLGLVPLTAGDISFDGQSLQQMAPRALRAVRRHMQMIFQDPYATLSPRLSMAYILAEPYRINRVPADQQYEIDELLAMVGLPPEIAPKYAHELSGGQARRVGIARALALNPQFIVADEPTAGLDVSAAASILNLLKDLVARLDLACLVITHNLNVVGFLARRTAVMYMGKVVEVGPTSHLLDSPSHPYTMSLLSSVAEPDPQRRRGGRRLLLAGEIPSPRNPPQGCRFHTRCPFAQERSRIEVPELEVVEGEHQVACHYWREIREGNRATVSQLGVPLPGERP